MMGRPGGDRPHGGLLGIRCFGFAFDDAFLPAGWRLEPIAVVVGLGGVRMVGVLGPSGRRPTSRSRPPRRLRGR